MSDNYIVDEVHRIRAEMLAEYGGDLKALLKDMQRKTEESARQGRKVISPIVRPDERLSKKKKAG